MNRRSFLDSLIKAGVGFAILPTATTYTRHWSGLLVPKGQSLGYELWTTKLFLWRDGHWEEQSGENILEWQPPLLMPPGVQLLPMEVKYDRIGS